MESIKQNPLVKKVGFNRIVLCIVLLLMYGLFCALTGGAFFGLRRILSAPWDSYHWQLRLSSRQVELTSPSDRSCSAVH